MLLQHENPTRQKILMLLKKNDGLTIEDLSRHMKITSMGVRQHLISLERKGYVKYEVLKHGIGRPKFIYRLTNKSQDMFPQTYRSLLSDVLSYIYTTGGPDKLDEIFSERNKKLLDEWEAILPPKGNQKKRIHTFVDSLNKNGYMAEAGERDDHFELTNYHCTIIEIAGQYHIPCKHELELIKQLHGPGTIQKECLAKDDSRCLFIIPKA